MVSPSRWNASGATLFQLGAEGVWVFAAVLLAFHLRGTSGLAAFTIVGPAVVFALLMTLMQLALGMYRRDQRISVASYASRLIVAMFIAVPMAYVMANVIPGGRPFQDTLAESVLIAFAGLVLVRHLVTRPVLTHLIPHRVLILGTGPEARLVEAALATSVHTGVELVGFYGLEKTDENVVAPNRILPRRRSLDEAVTSLGVDEIIVAVRQQRGGVLPLRGLLECRLSGVRVTDLARFFERVHGQIPIESLKASWLIYGNGFRQGWLRTTTKRLFDVTAALAFIVLTLPVMIVVALIIATDSGFPIIYRQQRVGLRGKTFDVLKFRSMQDAEKDGKATWAAVGDNRVTRFGRFIRRTRIDELPQLLNVLRGEMSFVGPRPERPVFVTMLTEQIPFYAVRHSVKPGITGWAQVRYSYGANVEQAMRKLEYDLYYVKNHSLLLDIVILVKTVRVVLLGEGVR